MVWFINGLLAKVLNLVPRHQEIVERILQVSDGRTLTFFIGLSEIAMAVWIISGRYSRLNAMVQIGLILTMNILEYTLASDLLLWKKMNIVFALAFALFVYLNEFKLTRK
jgi:hypothetical protein